MPRAPAVDIDNIFEAIKDYPLFDENGCLKTATALVWNLIVDQKKIPLENIKIKNLHKKVYENNHGIQTKLRKHQNIKSANQKKVLENPLASTPKNILKELLELKISEKYKHVIHQIKANKFSVRYWYPQQTNLAKEIAMYTDQGISLLLIHNQVLKALLGDHLTDFLSIIIICSADNVHMYPLRQVVSEEAFDKNFIQTFLREVLKSKFPLPQNISLPFSFVHVESVSLVFNKLSLGSYLDEVFGLLNHNTTVIVKTFLHIDFMQLLVVLKNLKYETDVAQRFFLHAIIHLSKIKDLETFEATVIDLFSLFDNRYENEIVKEIKDSFRNNFANEIKHIYETLIEAEQTYKSKFNFLTADNFSFWTISSGNKISLYAKGLKNKAKITTRSENQFSLNGYFSPKVSNYLLKCLTLFPLFTQMLPHIPSESSKLAIDHMEKHFDLPQELDIVEFVLKDLSVLETIISNASNVIEVSKNQRLPKTITISSDCDYLSHEENWMGKINSNETVEVDDPSVKQLPSISMDMDKIFDVEIPKQSNNVDISFSSLEQYVDSDESFDPMNDRLFGKSFKGISHSTPIKNKSKQDKDLETSNNLQNRNFNKKEKLSRVKQGQFTSKFPALRAYHAMNTKNKMRMDVQIRSGSAFGLKPINGKKYQLRQTSVFDSLAEVFIFISRNYSNFQSFCESLKCNGSSCFYLAISDFCKSGKAQTIYKHRAQILIRCGVIKDNFIDIDKTPGDFFFSMLNEPETQHVAFIKNKKCTFCKNETSYFVSNLRLSIPQLPLKDLNHYLEYFFSESRCASLECQNELVSVSYQLGEFLAIDLECNEIDAFLGTVPQTVSILGGKKFLLAGVIARNGSEKHYTAYCRTSDNQWYQRDNTKRPKAGAIGTYPRVAIAMIFYIFCESETT